MPLFDFFRNFFGRRDKEDLGSDRLNDSQFGGHDFRKPIWQNDDDDNDDDDDFRRFRGDMHFSIFTDPLEITRYFEAQMDHMLKDFFSGFDHGVIFSFPEGNNNMLGPPSLQPPRQKDSLRNKMLKPGYELPSDSYDQKTKVDADLDGKVSVDDFSKIWDRPETKKSLTPFTNFHQSSKSMSKKYVRRPDGTIEEQQVIRDSEGNEETITSRQIGDKKYVISVKRDKDGKEIKTEDLINMDENELKEFKQRWETQSNPGISNSDNPSRLLKYFPWEKFFDLNPKL